MFRLVILSFLSLYVHSSRTSEVRHASPTPVQLHVIILIHDARVRSSHSNAFIVSFFAFFRQFHGIGAEWQIIAARDIRIELTRACNSRYVKANNFKGKVEKKKKKIHVVGFPTLGIISRETLEPRAISMTIESSRLL